MRIARVAIARGPRRELTWSVPDGLEDRVLPGCRVLVPLGRGNRRLTGYVVALDEVDPAELGYPIKPVADVLDPEPLFDDALLTLFRFIARYYHASLGDVIRTGLPAGLNVADARVVALTAEGRARLGEDPILRRLVAGDHPARELDVPMARLVRLADKGLVALRYELERQRVRPRFVQVVAPTGEAPSVPLRAGAGPALLLALLRAEGTQELRGLKGRVPNHGASVRRLVELGAAAVDSVQLFRDPWRGEVEERDRPPVLTAAQTESVAAIQAAIDHDVYQGFLLHGVTGSGKTEVYLHSLQHALRLGRGGIVLVPEIALTPQLAGRFRARFGDEVAVLHSGLSDGERLDQWELIRRGDRRVVVGARSALFAPVRELGLIVVDEEHESSFKQDDTPRYHARDMALKRGHGLSVPVVLGSATPSLETVANAEAGRLVKLQLPGRIGSQGLPPVELIDLREHPPIRPEGLISRPLIDAIREVVARQEQAIIFLNRRGYASCLLCRRCGSVPECTNCSISLTYHRSRRRLSCHYCGHSAPVPSACPECDHDQLELLGTGTEQVERVLADELPEARVARMDRDTTRGRALRSLLNRFRAREIDVLVGTQMVAKGHDFPRVTLVGVLLAEQMLKLPDFRASERTFQLLTQVAGRAGRDALPGRVLVQTFDPRHYSLQCAIRHDVASFVRRELQDRKLRGYPPVGHLVLIRLDATEALVARDAAGRVARLLRETIRAGGLPADLIGPNPAALERIKGRTRYHMLLRSAERAALHAALAALQEPDPKLLGRARLAVDVDPLSML